MGSLIDGGFTIALQSVLSVLIVLVKYGKLASPLAVFSLDRDLGNTNIVASTLIALAFQGALIARRGQSLGKIAARTLIVHDNGRVAGFYEGFVLRSLPVSGAMLLPKLLEATGTPAATARTFSNGVGLLALIDVLMIFGSRSQCGHDRFAGTFVAKAAPQGPPAEPPARAPAKKRKRKKVPVPVSAD
jgi:uncharacterized RDD family membrane protein YckC